MDKNKKKILYKHRFIEILLKSDNKKIKVTLVIMGYKCFISKCQLFLSIVGFNLFFICFLYITLVS